MLANFSPKTAQSFNGHTLRETCASIAQIRGRARRLLHWGIPCFSDTPGLCRIGRGDSFSGDCFLCASIVGPWPWNLVHPGRALLLLRALAIHGRFGQHGLISSLPELKAEREITWSKIALTGDLPQYFAGDIAGDSRLMCSEEEGTLRQLKAHRKELVYPKITEHRGRITAHTAGSTSSKCRTRAESSCCSIPKADIARRYKASLGVSQDRSADSGVQRNCAEGESSVGAPAAFHKTIACKTQRYDQYSISPIGRLG
jgi:hypothetical protein